ncbi:9-hexadecenoic acid cis-trans isomerase [Alteromonas sp. KUL156]|nr:9-hexadecenoic acid cis-trans isomerase [Alteromonas sp. KUL154]GFD98842.1 9-hexadecenoic acid cis-trans isomerase [Alteromonas sp. KUL156]
MKKLGVIALLVTVLAIALWQWPTPDSPLLTESESFRVETQLPDNFFDEHVSPVLTQRCVVCHACYDAPCQLKMTSSEGIARGANKEKVYEGTRITAAQPNRMFLDAHSTGAWRERGFFDVLPAEHQTTASKTQSSVLAQMLLLKKQHPLPDAHHLGSGFDISLNRENQCPTIDEMGGYIAEQPLGGMPYALPGLTDSEHNTLMQWIHNGAPLSEPKILSDELKAEVLALEKWLNGNSSKMQLSARYIYEHLFTSHLYFEDVTAEKATPQFFNLVRSRTPSGEPIDIIATRRPFDDPKVDRVYYRLQPVFSTIVSKTHQAYAINEALIDKWHSWFVDANFEVSTLPSYEPEVAANPLTAFDSLPVESRYRFMLERAQNTIMGYIKGPVCRGQVALNVINDRFWVFFVDPDIAASKKMNAFYASQRENLHLPAEKDSSALAVNWVKYAKRQGEYLRARTAFMNEEFKNGEHLNIASIWDGDGNNTNASLTVFRHFDNATVVKGMTGEPTKTAWVIDYALLERIHYLLVAGFDVYGNYGHQLMTRLYMDFLRMEGESNFLNLLPPKTRHTLLSEWYQNASPELTDYLEGDINSFEQPSGIVFDTDKPQQELYQMLLEHLSDVLPAESTFDKSMLSDEQFSALANLDFLPAKQATLMPETTVIVVRDDTDPGKIDVFTALRNSAHYNVNSLFEEEENREPSKDSITLVHGLLGSYPDAFWFIKASEVIGSIEHLHTIQSEADYKALLDKVGMRRTNSEFWTFSDNLLRWSKEQYPIEGGLLDYNRLEDR